MMFAVGCLGVMAAAGAAMAGGGNSGAAQTCQQGGYLNMHRSDGSSFKNVGDCVSYFAQKGTAGAACTVVSGSSGCLTFNNVVMPDVYGSGDTITLNGSFSFSTTACLNAVCDNLPNAYATGGGTYTIDDSSGNVLESGTLVADNTTGTQEGLYFTNFTDANGNPTTCSAAEEREVDVLPSTSNRTTDPTLATIGDTLGGTTPDESAEVETYAGALFAAGGLSGVTISC